MFLTQSRYALPAGAVTAALLVYALLRPYSKSPSCLASPRDTVLPQLSQGEIDSLPYPPDALPGGRDVETPYGTFKVFEWGPLNGRKVLFIHGISTPCVSLGEVAERLVQSGCRVMLFDLFGRGWSDTPTDVTHDARLYTTQILLALTSSPLCWTGDAVFDIVGYSFGGGVGAYFTRFFARLVRSVILLAPGGIIREKHIGIRSRILYSRGILPEPLLMYLVLRRLRPKPKPDAAGTGTSDQQNPGDGGDDATVPLAEAAVGAEVGRTESRDGREAPVQQLPIRPGINPDLAVAWQIEHHKGFVSAFMGSIRHGPIHDQREIWAGLGQILSQRRAEGGSSPYADKVLLVLGARDPIVLAEEVAEDTKAVMGPDNVRVQLIDGAHDFPMAESAQLAKVIRDFWSDEST